MLWAHLRSDKAAPELAEINGINANFLISCFLVIKEWKSISLMENGWEQAGCFSAFMELRCFISSSYHFLCI